MSRNTDDCHFASDYGLDALMISVLTDQAHRWQDYADSLDIPLEQFVRQGVELLCESLLAERVRYEMEEIAGDETTADIVPFRVH